MNTIIKIIFYPIYLLYKSLIFLRNYFFDKKILKTKRLPCKVISIGNITTGGTGKTPTVLFVTQFLKHHYNHKVAILSRGYGRKTKGTVLVTDGKGSLINWEYAGDEPYMLAKKLSDTPIVVDANRYRGGMFLVKN